jgi:predicted nucleotidyltransferase
MLFSELMNAVPEPEMRPVIVRLPELKTAAPEIGEGRRIDELNTYLDKSLESLKRMIDIMPPDKKTGWERLDELFYDVLGAQAVVDRSMTR